MAWLAYSWMALFAMNRGAGEVVVWPMRSFDPLPWVNRY